jgi:hypothetical protein
VPVSAILQDAGNIGIGNNSPQSKLHVYDASNSLIALGRAGNPQALAKWEYNSGTCSFGTRDTDNLELITNNVSRLFMNTVGNVGVGTSSPTAKLDVNGDVKATNTPKAWVNFDGINGSTVGGEFRCNILKNYNINKVVRTATGRYTVYFTTAAPDAYYVTTGACNYNNANDDNLTIFSIGSQYTSYCQVVSRGYGTAAGYFNPSSMQVLIHY